ncbi:MAG: transketolase [Bacteroidetes bacterium]|nr:transketolase [Bacteroidota bacterium]
MKRISDPEKLCTLAKNIRIDVVRSVTEAGSGHTGGSLGLADVFTVLFFNVLNHRPSEPDWPDRDRLVLSIGHVAPVLYASLAHAGYFDRNELLTLRKLESRLQGHPGKEHGLPGIELSSGSLGQGLSVAVGLALGAKIDRKDRRVYSVHGDGELQEGSIWEAAMSAAHYKLDNLIAIVDRNYVQIDGNTEDVMAIEPLADKWRSFGWEVFACNGNSPADLLNAFDKARNVLGKPSVIIAETKMGYGVKSIEGDCRWHGKAPAKEQAQEFIRELRAL